MSSGMNMEEAEKIADKMSYREAIMNCLCARCVPYRKATKIKMKRLLESIEAPYVDLDTPMHFTPEQKAWVKKYISINAERQRADAIDEALYEYAFWLFTNYSGGGAVGGSVAHDNAVKSIEEFKQMQKGTENDV